MRLLPEPPTPPPAQAIAAQISHQINGAFEDMIQRHVMLFQLFWRSDHATPDEIAAALGSGGAAFWVAAGVSSQAIKATCDHLGLNFDEVLPAEYRVPPREVTINADGTLTIAPPVRR
jgi:hypothetical protein